MSRYIVAALVLGTISFVSLVLTSAGVTPDSSLLAFNQLHALIATLGALFLLGLLRFPSRQVLAMCTVAFAVVTFGLGLLELALFLSALLDSCAPGAASVLSGAIFLAQGLVTFRGLRVRVILQRTDPPSGPGPFAPV